jgi:hypothetical protein
MVAVSLETRTVMLTVQLESRDALSTFPLGISRYTGSSSFQFYNQQPPVTLLVLHGLGMIFVWART